MCEPFSTLQNINYSKLQQKEVETKLMSATQRVKFAIQVRLEQYRQGGLFLFEHPASASLRVHGLEASCDS